MSFQILACCYSCQSAINHNVSDAVAAQAVSAVQSACHLACSIESGISFRILYELNLIIMTD